MKSRSACEITDVTERQIRLDWADLDKLHVSWDIGRGVWRLAGLTPVQYISISVSSLTVSFSFSFLVLLCVYYGSFVLVRLTGRRHRTGTGINELLALRLRLD